MTNAVSHNGGKNQTNLNFLQTAGDYPFINCLKTGQFWGRTSGNLPVTPDIVDANGYPTSLPSGVSTVFYVPTARDRPSVNGNKYVITWTGNGTISCVFNNTLVSGSLTGSGGSGRYVFTTTDFRFDLRITALPVTNLACYHIDDEPDYLAGEIFSSKFKAKIIEGGIGVIRFLNWQQHNVSNVASWSDRKPVGYVVYNDVEARASIYAGATTNVANAYTTASFPSIHSSDGTAWTSGGPKDKDLVSVLFNASATQSGTCSLDIGNTGSPINILNEYCNALSSNTNTYPIGATFQSFGTLFYDAALGAWVKMGGDAAFESKGIYNGVPIEVCLRLCSEVGAHPHFVAPFFSVTPATDFNRQLAIYCRDNSPSWLKPRFEGPNELWNIGTAYALGTNYARKIANGVYGWPTSANDDINNWYGKVMSTMGQDIYSVYSNDTTKFALICGVQTGFGDTAPNRATHDPRMTAVRYLSQTAQSGYSLTASKNYITHVCVALYVSPGIYSEASEATMGLAYAAKQFTASISGTTLTVTDVLSNLQTPFAVGDYIYGNSAFQNGAGTIAGTRIAALTASTTPQTITGITQANPAVVTITTPPADGTKIYIAGAATSGMTQLADGWYTARNPSGGTFQLYSFGNSAVNSSAYTAYSGSGATAQPVGTYTINYSQTVASGQMTGCADPSQLDSYVDALITGGTHGAPIPLINTLYQNWKAWAVSWIPTVKYTGYEGGYSPDTGGGATSLTNRLRVASKNSPRLAQYMLLNLSNFEAVGSEFPATGYNFSGNADVFAQPLDAWAVLNGIYQPDPPQWVAFKNYQAGKKRLIAKA
jgi:hypothetical protein